MRPFTVHATGIGLFLFIPVVLYLFVVHPEPVGWSLAGGVVLMLGHRFVARPYMNRIRAVRCIWCARVDVEGAPRETVAVRAGGGDVAFVACPRHADPARRFFDWLDRCRTPLRLGIGLPLVALLAAIAWTAAGRAVPLAPATDAFRFVVGGSVHLAALGPALGRADSSPRAAFPLHNFSLLGVRNLLWIFRLIGAWWLLAGGAGLWRAYAG